MATTSLLRLRPLRLDDETAFLAAHRVMAGDDDFTFGLDLKPGMPWSAYLRLLAAQQAGRNLPPGYVPATFLVADVAGEIVGRTSIRHTLNDVLRREGGHIGYGVLPQYRRRGYATEILRQSLIIARAIGIGPVPVICDEGNIGSAAVIEACDGKLDSAAMPGDTPPRRRYWID